MIKYIRILAVFALIAITGCDIFEETGAMCSDEYVYGVRADIQLPNTTGNPEWSGAVRLTTMGYDEELTVLPTAEGGRFVTFGAGERPGTYKLTVEISGHKKWERADIVVSDNVCHVDQAKVTVQLEEE